MPYNFIKLTNFQTFFTVRIRIKFEIIGLKIASHLKCVATLLYLDREVSRSQSNSWKQDFCNNTFKNLSKKATCFLSQLYIL